MTDAKRHKPHPDARPRLSLLVLLLVLLTGAVAAVPWLLPIAQGSLPRTLALRTTSAATPACTDAPGRLTVVTLAFDVAEGSPDHDMISHNCAVVSRTRHRFVIHTDEVSRRYCQVCECVRFVKKDCKCPRPGLFDCPLCEKLHFLRAQLLELGEFVFVDSDLIILKDEFLDRMYLRSRAHDFLARHGPIAAASGKYYGTMNSGLLFMRRVPGVDYNEMIRLMWRTRSNNDQNVVSEFVFKYYHNWDTLSMRWHCRYLKRVRADIPLQECYTLHSRDQVVETLRDMNRTLLQV